MSGSGSLTTTAAPNVVPPSDEAAIRMTFGLKNDAPVGVLLFVFQATYTRTLLAAVCAAASGSVWVVVLPSELTSENVPLFVSMATTGLYASSLSTHL